MYDMRVATSWFNAFSDHAQQSTPNAPICHKVLAEVRFVDHHSAKDRLLSSIAEIYEGREDSGGAVSFTFSPFSEIVSRFSDRCSNNVKGYNAGHNKNTSQAIGKNAAVTTYWY
jgi:hypothetical protein